jgi:hypothetical protein
VNLEMVDLTPPKITLSDSSKKQQEGLGIANDHFVSVNERKKGIRSVVRHYLLKWQLHCT